MKFLEAKKMADGGDNKMQPGSRPDQAIRRGQLHPDNPPPTKKEVVAYAKEHGLDLATITGTGRGGEITLKDVKDAKMGQEKEPE